MPPRAALHGQVSLTNDDDRPYGNFMYTRPGVGSTWAQGGGTESAETEADVLPSPARLDGAVRQGVAKRGGTTQKGFITFLLAQRYIDKDQLLFAEQDAKQHPRFSVLESLLRLSYVSKGSLEKAWKEYRPSQLVDWARLEVPPFVQRTWPARLAIRYTCLVVPHQPQTACGEDHVPSSPSSSHFAVITPQPDDIILRDALRRYFPDATLHFLWAPHREVHDQLSKVYPDGDTLHHHITELHQSLGGDRGTSDQIASPLTPILIEKTLEDAVGHRASDIHFLPEEQATKICYRIDGIIVPVRSIHGRFWPSLCGRLKIMAGLNLAEHRVPQNGRFTLPLGGQTVDCRLGIMPTCYGESAVVRLLDKHVAPPHTEQLGFQDAVRHQLTKLIHEPDGLIVFVGPTGSGKSTTLHALLQEKAREGVKIMTLEQPIEYLQPFAVQTEISDNGPVSFPVGVKALLRQDPDVLLVGEVRDEETASVTLRAALTGHLVLTTLHAPSATGALRRLHNLGLSPDSIQSCLKAVVIQRLLRRVCGACHEGDQDRGHDEEGSCVADNPLPQRGCEACFYTGYKGRLAIGEVWHVAPSLDASASSASHLNLRLATPSLADQALMLVTDGVTTGGEVSRVLGPDWRKTILKGVPGRSGVLAQASGQVSLTDAESAA